MRMLALKLVHRRLQTCKVAAMLYFFNDRQKPAISLIEVGKPRASSANITGKNHGYESFLITSEKNRAIGSSGDRVK